MTTILLVIHLLLALALVGAVLLQRSEGGGLGIGGGGGGMGSFMSSRATADLLTRTTAILAACFMASSLLLAYLAGDKVDPSTSVLEQLDESAVEETMPVAVPANELDAKMPAIPAQDMPADMPPASSEPSVPVDK